MLQGAIGSILDYRQALAGIVSRCRKPETVGALKVQDLSFSVTDINPASSNMYPAVMLLLRGVK